MDIKISEQKVYEKQDIYSPKVSSQGYLLITKGK